MKISLDYEGGVLLELDDIEEARALADDIHEAADVPGEDIITSLINADGVMQMTVRCVGS